MRFLTFIWCFLWIDRLHLIFSSVSHYTGQRSISRVCVSRNRTHHHEFTGCKYYDTSRYLCTLYLAPFCLCEEVVTWVWVSLSLCRWARSRPRGEQVTIGSNFIKKGPIYTDKEAENTKSINPC